MRHQKSNHQKRKEIQWQKKTTKKVKNNFKRENV